MSNGPLGVSDEDFWRDPFAAREAVIDRLASDGLQGLVLDAPSVVRIDLRDDVPIAGARRVLASRERPGRFHERAVLAVMRAESNEVLAARAFEWKEPAHPPDDGPKEPAAPESDAVMTDFFYASLRERIEALPWREGTLSVTLLDDDDRSNTVVVSLARAPERDAAVRDFVARNRSPGYPRAVHPVADPRAGVPVYRAMPDTPTLPSALGIAFTVSPLVTLGEAARCVVRGSFALPVIEREIVKPFDAHFDRFGALDGAGFVDVGDTDAKAVVALHFVVTADRIEEPAVLRVDVPVYDPVAPGDAGTIVRGSFTIDLLAHPGMFRTPGKYRVWALSGEAIVGPRTVDLAPPR